MHFAQHFARVHLFVIVCTRDKISNTACRRSDPGSVRGRTLSELTEVARLHARLVGAVGERFQLRFRDPQGRDLRIEFL